MFSGDCDKIVTVGSRFETLNISQETMDKSANVNANVTRTATVSTSGRCVCATGYAACRAFVRKRSAGSCRIHLTARST